MVFHRAKHKKYKIEINRVFIEQVKHENIFGAIFDDPGGYRTVDECGLNRNWKLEKNKKSQKL